MKQMKRRYRGETSLPNWNLCWPNVKAFTHNEKQTSIKLCGIVQDPVELQFTIHGFEML